MFKDRMTTLQARLDAAGIDVALITDDDSVYYLTGYYDYLHMDFGRPTILVISREGSSLLITPSMEEDMAHAAARVDRIAVWNDGLGDEWRAEIPAAIARARAIGIEPDQMPPLVRGYLDRVMDAQTILDVTPILADMRMIK